MTSDHKHFTLIIPTLTFLSHLTANKVINLNKVFIAAYKPCCCETFSTSLIVSGYHKHRASLRRTHNLPQTLCTTVAYSFTHVFYTSILQITSQFFSTK